jgi:hypothetical protein
MPAPGLGIVSSKASARPKTCQQKQRVHNGVHRIHEHVSKRGYASEKSAGRPQNRQKARQQSKPSGSLTTKASQNSRQKELHKKSKDDRPQYRPSPSSYWRPDAIQEGTHRNPPH